MQSQFVTNCVTRGIGMIGKLTPRAHKVAMAFSRPGKPPDHAHIESFNGSLRDECLNLHWFQTIEEAKEHLEAWRQEYNETRPHRALNNLAPRHYLAQWAEQRPETN